MLQPTPAAPAASPSPLAGRASRAVRPVTAEASAGHWLGCAWASAGRRARPAQAADGHGRPAARARKLASGLRLRPAAATSSNSAV
jgi:hypothetical protein